MRLYERKLYTCYELRYSEGLRTLFDVVLSLTCVATHYSFHCISPIDQKNSHHDRELNRNLVLSSETPQPPQRWVKLERALLRTIVTRAATRQKRCSDMTGVALKCTCFSTPTPRRFGGDVAWLPSYHVTAIPE